jgi:hypothetical protein
MFNQQELRVSLVNAEVTEGETEKIPISVMSGIWFSIDYRQIDGRIYSDEMLLIG